MKLGYCPACKDIFKLTTNVRECSCGKTSGVMKNKELAQITGPMKVLGINDKSLYEAIANQPARGPGKEFVAFVLPKANKGVIKIIPPTGTQWSPGKYEQALGRAKRSPYLPKVEPVEEATEIEPGSTVAPVVVTDEMQIVGNPEVLLRTL